MSVSLSDDDGDAGYGTSVVLSVDIGPLNFFGEVKLSCVE